MDLRVIEPEGSTYAGELDLRYRVLRAPLGYSRNQVPFPFEKESLHLVALDGDRVVGCVIFHPTADGMTGRLYQMAIDPAQQRRGLGRRLVLHLEEELRRRGLEEVTLHSRQYAVGFYERLGYRCFGEPFTEVGIPHRHMRRSLVAGVREQAKKTTPQEDGQP
ncbi:GNAT family N-acetyltransferase [Planctomycetota bacterium]